MSIREVNIKTGEVTVRELTAAEEEQRDAAILANTAPLTNADVNAERARRVAAGCVVNVTGEGAIPVQGRDEDKANLQGLVTAAQLRLASGDTTTTTLFRDLNNVDHDLTPAQMIELWQLSAAFVSDVYEASWALKDQDPIPADYADDVHWPDAG